MFKKKDRVLASLIAFMMIFSLVVTPKSAEAVGEPTLEISIPESNYQVGDTFVAQVKVSDVTFNASQVVVYFNPEVLQVEEDGLVMNQAHAPKQYGGDGKWTYYLLTIDNTNGIANAGVYSAPPGTVYDVPAEGEDYIGIRFKAIGEGDANIHFARAIEPKSPAFIVAAEMGYEFISPGDGGSIIAIMTLKEPDVYVDTAPETFGVTIAGDADVTTDYVITGAPNLEEVVEGTALTVTAVTDITVNGEKVATGETKEITINEATTITINKDVPATTYTVTFKDHDGTVLSTEEVEEGQAAPAPADPTREGYTFAGWDVEFANVTSDLTVIATYTEDEEPVTKYTVTFKDHDGTVLSTEEVEEGQAAPAPADPTREGYTFAGWDVEFDNVTSDLTVTATYTKDEEPPATYTVTIAGDAVETRDYTIAGADDLSALEGEVTLTVKAVRDIRVNGKRVLRGYTEAITVNAATTITINKYVESPREDISRPPTIRTYIIETSAGIGGIIDADKIVRVRSGRNIEFEIKPDEDYEIEDVRVDGRSVGAVDSYEFRRVRADHTISATFKKIEVIEPVEEPKQDFIDVPVNEWYYASVMKATDKGWFTGTSEITFSPNIPMSRGMIVTVLWRMENEPVSNVNSFADVMANNYYTTAVNWASEKGIVTGYSNGLFGPNDSITREQMASILYRYAQYKGYNITQGGMAIREFLDYEDISEYALSPLAWAVNTGLIQGSNNKLMPKDSATRAQVAAILVRFSEIVVK